MVTLESTLKGLKEIIGKHKLPIKPEPITQLNQDDYGGYLRERVTLNIELYEFVKKDYPAIDKFSLRGIDYTP